ncbi:MAG: hypothetical protein Q9191_000197 [Dirinaria sp. TL-2023a]
MASEDHDRPFFAKKAAHFLLGRDDMQYLDLKAYMSGTFPILVDTGTDVLPIIVALDESYTDFREAVEASFNLKSLPKVYVLWGNEFNAQEVNENSFAAVLRALQQNSPCKSRFQLFAPRLD